MTFPDDYPFNPPTFKFNNAFYHPNGKNKKRFCNKNYILTCVCYCSLP